MKKAYVSTYCEWSSFGSVLQALSLQKSLQGLGYSSTVLKNNAAPNAAWSMPRLHGANIKNIIAHGHTFLIRKKLKKGYAANNAFIKNNVSINYYPDYNALKSNPPVADAYIAGSDQIWNPKLIKPDFFLDYAPADATKIAYAASMGSLNISDDTKGIYKDYLAKFNSISVREQDCAEIIKQCTDKPVTINIDPVFLTSADAWQKYESPYPIKKPYILVYAIYWDKSLNGALKQLHRTTGMDIVAVSGKLQRVYANKRVYDVGTDGFLWLVRNANAVVTSSFHGLAMSLIYNKRVYPVVNPASPSRLANLLNVLKVQTPSSLAQLLSYSPNYDEVNQNILVHRQAGLDYLTAALA